MTDSDRPAPAEASVEEWRRVVRKALGDCDLATLNSATRDGIVIEPFYARRRDAVRVAGRGADPWIVVQAVDASDPDAANAQALADLNGGATGLSLRFKGAGTQAAEGLPLDAEALAIALDTVDVAAAHLRVEPHPEAVAIAGWLRDRVEVSGTAPELTDISFGLDPVAILSGGEAERFAGLLPCMQTLAAAGFRGPFATLDARLYHEAGASEAQEIASVLAGAAWWLREADNAGAAPDDCLPLLEASISADRDQFLTIAKLRALQLVWARFLELCHVPQQALRVHAETSRRMLTRADPATNLLRNTIAAFAAGVGGAHSVMVVPHMAALGPADGNARALARNIQLLLLEESHVFRVADAAAGSGLVEALTEGLAERAWDEFQAIERDGGIVASLQAGTFQARIAEARTALKDEVTSGKAPLIGATLYPAADDADAAPTPEPHEAPNDVLAALALAPVRLEALAEGAAP